jgi:hypothetical protein
MVYWLVKHVSTAYQIGVVSNLVVVVDYQPAPSHVVQCV